MIQKNVFSGNRRKFFVSGTRRCRFAAILLHLTPKSRFLEEELLWFDSILLTFQRRSRRGRQSRSGSWRVRSSSRSCCCRRRGLRSRWKFYLSEKKYKIRYLLRKEKTRFVIKVLENENLALVAVLGNLKEQLSQVSNSFLLTKIRKFIWNQWRNKLFVN